MSCFPHGQHPKDFLGKMELNTSCPPSHRSSQQSAPVFLQNFGIFCSSEEKGKRREGKGGKKEGTKTRGRQGKEAGGGIFCLPTAGADPWHQEQLAGSSSPLCSARLPSAPAAPGRLPRAPSWHGDKQPWAAAPRSPGVPPAAKLGSAKPGLSRAGHPNPARSTCPQNPNFSPRFPSQRSSSLEMEGSW